MSIDQFRDRVAGRDISAGTADEYEPWIKRFQAWNDGSPITEGLLRDFDSALEDPEEVPLTDRTEAFAYSTRRKALSAILKWARVMHDVDVRPDVDDLIRGEEGTFDPTVLARSEIERVIDQDCPLTGCRAARVTGYDLIMRSSELTDIRPGDVNPDQGTVYVRAKKGSENRTLTVTDRTMNLLLGQIDRVNRWFNRPKYVFYNTYRNSLSDNAWTQHFLDHHHDAGFHAFGRHSPIVHYLRERGFGQTYLRARHSHPSMTARYASIAGVEVPTWAES